jgi:hypothetical protein
MLWFKTLYEAGGLPKLNAVAINCDCIQTGVFSLFSIAGRIWSDISEAVHTRRARCHLERFSW